MKCPLSLPFHDITWNDTFIYILNEKIFAFSACRCRQHSSLNVMICVECKVDIIWDLIIMQKLKTIV